ncbi:MAG TPA: riboflavin synthase [Puia sp.]|nr:riboflavin synthase [Puia sp.]
MFTGIIESLGTIQTANTLGTNKVFWIESPISAELKVDQSLSHNGACLTVEEIKDGMHRVTAIEETLRKTNLGTWKAGDLINLERCLVMNGRLDGHIVQGHVDSTATCLERKELDGSWEFQFGFPRKFSHLIIEKGSICLNGISLTLFDIKKRQFKIAVIPYTFDHTNIRNVFAGNKVNIEFDMIGKYVSRLQRSK